MNRETKFRGKTSHSDEWCFGSLVDYGDGEMEIQGFDVFHEGLDAWKEMSVDPDTVGQFTGLHDANGKEIYEGDIFQVKAYEPKFEVYFKRGAFEYRQIGSSNRPFQLRRIYFDSYVLGNIHDNPELLKGGGK